MRYRRLLIHPHMHMPSLAPLVDGAWATITTTDDDTGNVIRVERFAGAAIRLPRSRRAVAVLWQGGRSWRPRQLRLRIRDIVMRALGRSQTRTHVVQFDARKQHQLHAERRPDIPAPWPWLDHDPEVRHQ